MLCRHLLISPWIGKSATRFLCGALMTKTMIIMTMITRKKRSKANSNLYISQSIICILLLGIIQPDMIHFGKKCMGAQNLVNNQNKSDVIELLRKDSKCSSCESFLHQPGAVRSLLDCPCFIYTSSNNY